jgi:hypothetical protein
MSSSCLLVRLSLCSVSNEFQRGRKFFEESSNSLVSWEDLCAESDFFKAHRYFVQINIVSSSQNQHDQWFAFVESRIRKLVEMLAVVPGVQARPFPFHYRNEPLQNCTISSSSEFCDCCFIGITFSPGANSSNLAEPFFKFKLLLQEGLLKFQRGNIESLLIRYSQLPTFVKPRKIKVFNQAADANIASPVLQSSKKTEHLLETPEMPDPLHVFDKSASTSLTPGVGTLALGQPTPAVSAAPSSLVSSSSGQKRKFVGAASQIPTSESINLSPAHRLNISASISASPPAPPSSDAKAPIIRARKKSKRNFRTMPSNVNS